ncbi:MAG: hypothetical protein RL760_411 [Candidatus Eisenbacteria bacterium]
MSAHDVPHRTLETGHPEPLGATLTPRGVNFAVVSHHATRMTLVLWEPGGRHRRDHVLDPRRHRTGDVWHAFVPDLAAGAEWAWRADSSATGPAHAFDPDALLLDPYTKGVAGSERWAERGLGGRPRELRGVVLDLSYDWGDDRAPRTPLAETVIHETHVRAFTAHPSSGVRHPGTYAGLAEKATWLAAQGFTAVQLMPVAEFDETDNPRTNPLTDEPLLNAWGYAPLAFMAPRTAYAADATTAGALREFRDMVRTLHRAGLEVILDVVYNHVGEGPRSSPPRSWRGLDRAEYFVLDAQGHDFDVTGCGHTFACARPVASRLILDTLRFWVEEMHVDGFRFDLAATLTRGEDGAPLIDPPLIREISEDPRLAGVKLIAEAWDGGLYQVGSFPHHGRWAELNGRFRDDVRDWLRGAARGPGALATRLGGSSDLYAPARTPAHSVNFVTCHDGFTLADLVSHERKHNLANGEQERDGTDDHRSWNGGAEGPTHDDEIRRIRLRQARNAAALTLLARGSALWLWGDDRLRTQRGNNNAWCQDGPAWWLDWTPDPDRDAFQRFVRGLLALRHRHGVLRGGEWFRSHGPGGVGWHDTSLASPDWDHGGALLQMHRYATDGPDLLLQVNGEPETRTFTLPESPVGTRWHILVDTAAESPHDVVPLEHSRPVHDPLQDRLHDAVAGRSLRLLAAR